MKPTKRTTYTWPIADRSFVSWNPSKDELWFFGGDHPYRDKILSFKDARTLRDTLNDILSYIEKEPRNED
jgi:hypothetical protein